jgi:Ulp1 family protease
MNYVDCGVYLLEYAERFLLDPDEILHNITVEFQYSFLMVLEREE